MAEADDSTKKYKPLTEDLVRETLRKDKGETAQLVSWKYEDFTKKGDNYACFVTSVKVQYKEEQGALQEVSYVGKISHQIQSAFTDLINEVFQKEGTCFIEILPKMSEALRELHLDGIRTAKGYCMSLEVGKEVIMLEDLRARRFKMFDRRRGIDVPHANLVLKELGRFHAASLLTEKKLGCSLTETWPAIIEKWLQQDDDDAATAMFQKMIESQMETTAMVMEKIPNYEHVVAWIRRTKPIAMEIFKNGLMPGTKFDVLTHGDCWNNNILFRYDEAGEPVEVMLLDLQGVRKASVAADLSYFLYSSFNGDVRKNNLETFMTTYYNSFSNVLRMAQLPIPFSQEELLREFRDKMTLGCISGMILAPIVLSEEQDVTNFLDITEETIEKNNSERQATVLRMSKRKDGQLRDRFLSMFDEMMEAGIVSDGDATGQ